MRRYTLVIKGDTPVSTGDYVDIATDHGDMAVGLVMAVTPLEDGTRRLECVEAS